MSQPAALTIAALGWARLLDEAVHGDIIRTVFQPIVDLGARTVVGYEALTRFDHPDAPNCGPDRWFDAAVATGVPAALEARTLAAAFSHRSDLPPGCVLSVNVEPASLADPDVRAVFARQGDLTDVVVELTAHRTFHWDQVRSPVEDLGAAGARIAMDVSAYDPVGLSRLFAAAPDIVKLDNALVENIDADPARAALVTMIAGLADGVGASLLAEGVETAGEARRLSELGVQQCQGFLFGRPAATWSCVDPLVARALG